MRPSLVPEALRVHSTCSVQDLLGGDDLEYEVRSCQAVMFWSLHWWTHRLQGKRAIHCRLGRMVGNLGTMSIDTITVVGSGQIIRD